MSLIGRLSAVALIAVIGCKSDGIVGPRDLQYSATYEVLTSSPTKVRLIATITNNGTKAATINYGSCVMGYRIASQSGAVRANYEFDPLKSVCTMQLFTRMLAPGESFAINQLDAQLSGTVPPGSYDATVFLHIAGEPEIAVGRVEVK